MGRHLEDRKALGKLLILHRIVYADSSALVGLFSPEQNLQQVCEEVLEDLVRKYQVMFLTTNWVQYESLTRLRSHGIERCRRFQKLLNKDIFSVEPVSQELEVRSVEMFWAHDDKDWSIVDCSGFALMEERKILYAFAADHHFKQSGRIPLLEQAMDGIWEKSYEYLSFG